MIADLLARNDTLLRQQQAYENMIRRQMERRLGDVDARLQDIAPTAASDPVRAAEYARLIDERGQLLQLLAQSWRAS